MTEKVDGWDLSKCDPSLKEVLDNFDYNGDGFVSKEEVAQGADLFMKAQDKNERQKKQIYSLLAGYLFLVATIAGLVYGIVKANKDSQVVEVSGMATKPLMSLDSQPVSVNTNELEITLGMIAFLQFKALPKIKDIVFSPPTGDGILAMMRRVAAIDVKTNVSFTITTTMGDTLVWDSRSNYTPIDQMNITLHDGTYYEASVICTTCSAINAVWDDTDVIDSYDMYTEFFFGNIKEESTTNGGNRRLGSVENVIKDSPFGKNPRGKLPLQKQQKVISDELPFSNIHITRSLNNCWIGKRNSF